MRLSLPVVLALLAAAASVSWCVEEAGGAKSKPRGGPLDARGPPLECSGKRACHNGSEGGMLHHKIKFGCSTLGAPARLA